MLQSITSHSRKHRLEMSELHIVIDSHTPRTTRITLVAMCRPLIMPILVRHHHCNFIDKRDDARFLGDRPHEFDGAAYRIVTCMMYDRTCTFLGGPYVRVNVLGIHGTRCRESFLVWNTVVVVFIETNYVVHRHKESRKDHHFRFLLGLFCSSSSRA